MFVVLGFRLLIISAASIFVTAVADLPSTLCAPRSRRQRRTGGASDFPITSLTFSISPLARLVVGPMVRTRRRKIAGKPHGDTVFPPRSIAKSSGNAADADVVHVAGGDGSRHLRDRSIAYQGLNGWNDKGVGCKNRAALSNEIRYLGVINSCCHLIVVQS